VRDGAKRVWAYDWSFALITLGTLAAYSSWSFAITEWRTGFYRAAVCRRTPARPPGWSWISPDHTSIFVTFSGIVSPPSIAIGGSFYRIRSASCESSHRTRPRSIVPARPQKR
jgi:hypothetical protein